MIGQLLPALAETRQVIPAELQAHGHTADIDHPLRFEAMADDIAALIKQLGLTNADLCAYSLGGGVALQTAIRHPNAVHKLVLVSTPCKRAGWYPEDLAGMAAGNAQAPLGGVGSPVHEALVRVEPRRADWPGLCRHVGGLARP